MTKSERLLREMRQCGGMTHKEIVQFLLDLNFGFGKCTYNDPQHRDYCNATLYGTKERTGILERYCKQEDDGRYVVVRKIEGPFTGKRRKFYWNYSIHA